MNRSAKDEARSSQHYGGEGKPVHSSNQGVCGWHGMEDQYVTPGDLIRFSYGNEISDSISEKRNEKQSLMRSRMTEQYLKFHENEMTKIIGNRMELGKAVNKVVGKVRKVKE